MNNGNTFVASTVYNIYMSIFRIVQQNNGALDLKQNNLLVIVDNTKDIHKLFPNLKASIFFRNVITIPDNRAQRAGIGKFNKTFRKRKKTIEFLESSNNELKQEEAFISNSEIYLCDTDSAKNYFYLKFPKCTFYMIEDGLRAYCHIPTKMEILKKKYITRSIAGNGHGEEIKQVFSQFPDQLPPVLKRKATELNSKKIQETLSEDLKLKIYDVFAKGITLDIPTDKACSLIVTQPFSEEGFVEDEATKIRMYKDVVKKIPAGEIIVIKPHPREQTDYKSLFPEAIILNHLIPIEILSLKSELVFSNGYTLYSTALDNMDNIVTKHYLGIEYLSYVNSKDERQKITLLCEKRT